MERNYKYWIIRVVKINLLLLVGFGQLNHVNAQSLQSLIKMGLENSPEIQKYETQYARVAEQVNEVNTLPNTEFGLGYFVSEPETRTGAQKFKISAKQMLPWFGTISAKEQYGNALAEAVYEDVIIAKRKLIVSISQSYYNLYANHAKQVILDENIELLNTYEKMALSQVEVGKASAVDVLKLQIRENELVQLNAVLKEQYFAEQTNMNMLINRSKGDEVFIDDALFMPQQDLIKADSLQLHPELIKYDKLYHSVTQSELLNKKESSPMVGIGLDYINVEKRPGMDFSDNGKDIVMPMVAVSIPIFNKKYKSRTKQNTLKQQEILHEKELRFDRLQQSLDKAIANRNGARISYHTQIKNLEQAKDAEEILVKSYETGSIDFNDVLDIQELQLKMQINQVEAIKEYYVQSTIINYLIQ